jgi:two-component system response regulator RegA
MGPVPADSVLLVDDNEGLCRALARGFEHRGWVVAIAGSITEATRLLESATFRLVLIDLHLGEESGFGLIERAARRTPKPDVVLMSAYASIPIAVDAVRLGATTVLSKPVTVDSILSALRPGPSSPELELPSLHRSQWEHLQRALHDAGGNITVAAQRLKIPRRTLQRKLQKRPPA